MSPQEQNILTTINTLVMLFRAQKYTHPDLSEELQHTLKITQEHLSMAGLTVPVFVNTVQELYKKGYVLYAISPFEEKYRLAIQQFYDDDNYPKIREAFEKSDSKEILEKVRIALADATLASLPANLHIPREEMLAEEMTITGVLDASRELFKENPTEIISTIILSPFRSIERLLDKMNEGVRFDDVKDAGVWYDGNAYELHFDETTTSTAYQKKPTKAHFALKALFTKFGDSLIDYDDIPEFDSENKVKEMKSYSDALNRFIKKHPRLPEIFTVHTDRLEIHESYLEHPH